MSTARIFAFAMLLPLSVPLAQGAVPHEHGAATLDLVVDGKTLSIALESPLDNLVGFEHAPRSDKQKAALARMEKELRAGDRLFKPNAEAGCTLVESAVESPFPTGQTEKAGAGGHADADARWTFTCAKPDALRAVEVRLFETFPGLNRLKAQTATPRGQSSATLTPKRRTLAW